MTTTRRLLPSAAYCPMCDRVLYRDLERGGVTCLACCHPGPGRYASTALPEEAGEPGR